MLGVQRSQAIEKPDQTPPSWAPDAIWYQVYPSRFANGDPSNDLPGTMPWRLDWLEQPLDDLPDKEDLFLRRYGGDLQGLRAKLPYLQDLGVNTLYLNPVFAAGSEHKYDTIDLRHIDDSFGVAGSLERVVGETADPASWRWSDSDRVFLDFLSHAHRLGFRVVIDGVFNHVGRRFWAFEDVVRRGRNSPYAEWFEITEFGPPLQWNAWDGPNGHLPRFARTGDDLPSAVEQHIFAVTRRWMDPDGDGDPSDGIDGWRLDAPQDLPHDFWRRWRKQVKSINPEAIILGEIWTDPGKWLGDQFDSVTNYRLADAIIGWLRPEKQPRPVIEFANEVDRLARQFTVEQTLSLVNLLDSHDTDRAVSMLANPSRKYDRDNLPGAGDPPYDNSRPNDDAYARLKLAVTLQFTLPGAPMLYYGNELGMYGGEDPYSRAPMWWPEADGWDRVGYRPDLLDHFRALIRLRKKHAILRRGSFHVLLVDERRRLFAYERADSSGRWIVFVNAGSTTVEARLEFADPNDAPTIRVQPSSRANQDSTSPHREQGGTAIDWPCAPFEAIMVAKIAGKWEPVPIK